MVVRLGRVRDRGEHRLFRGQNDPFSDGEAEPRDEDSRACELLDRAAAEAIARDNLHKLDRPSDATAFIGDVCVYEGDGLDANGEALPRVGLWIQRDVPWSQDERDRFMSTEDLDDLNASALPYHPTPDDPEIGLGVLVSEHLSFHVWGAGEDLSVHRLIQFARTVADGLD